MDIEPSPAQPLTAAQILSIQSATAGRVYSNGGSSSGSSGARNNGASLVLMHSSDALNNCTPPVEAWKNKPAAPATALDSLHSLSISAGACGEGESKDFDLPQVQKGHLAPNSQSTKGSPFAPDSIPATVPTTISFPSPSLHLKLAIPVMYQTALATCRDMPLAQLHLQRQLLSNLEGAELMAQEGVDVLSDYPLQLDPAQLNAFNACCNRLDEQATGEVNKRWGSAQATLFGLAGAAKGALFRRTVRRSGRDRRSRDHGDNPSSAQTTNFCSYSTLAEGCSGSIQIYCHNAGSGGVTNLSTVEQQEQQQYHDQYQQQQLALLRALQSAQIDAVAHLHAFEDMHVLEHAAVVGVTLTHVATWMGSMAQLLSQ